MSEFERPLVLDDLTRAPARQRLEATPEECAALAERLGLLAMTGLRALLTILRKNARVTVTGHFAADVEQTCVVSLEPFTHTVEGEIDEEFFLTDDPENIEVEVDEHSAEPLTSDTLDLGEIVVQNLSLAIDPYPRSDAATLSDLEYEPKPETEADNPFAALSRLKLNG